MNDADFSKKVFRGAKILKVERDINVMISSLEGLLDHPELPPNQNGIIQAKIGGLRDAKEALIREFREE